MVATAARPSELVIKLKSREEIASVFNRECSARRYADDRANGIRKFVEDYQSTLKKIA